MKAGAASALLVGLLAGDVMAQGFFGPPPQPSQAPQPQAPPPQGGWYTGNPGAAAVSGPTGQANPYVGWASATAGDASYSPTADSQAYGPAGYGQPLNYGGYTSGPRWLFWLTPLFLLALAPAADALGKTSIGRGIAYLCLGASAFSATYPWANPWRHPWIYQWCEYMDWLHY